MRVLPWQKLMKLAWSLVKLARDLYKDVRANIREGRGLSIFLALVESIGLTGGLNNIRVEGQVTTTTAVVASVVTTVVAAVVLTVVLTVVASVLAVVLSVVAAVLTVVLTVVSTLAAKLGIGNTGCKQHRDEG